MRNLEKEVVQAMHSSIAEIKKLRSENKLLKENLEDLRKNLSEKELNIRELIKNLSNNNKKNEIRSKRKNKRN